MKRIILLTVLVILAGITFISYAQLDEGKTLYREGKYQQAINTLEPLLKKNPKDGNANYYIGASYFLMGNYADAISPLKMAQSRGVADACRMLAEIALDNYNVDDTDEYLSEWLSILNKNKQKPSERYNELKNHALLMRNMLERVEQIQIFDSIQVDADDFFKFYKLSHSAGSLLKSSQIGINNVASPGIVYRNANNTELYWAGQPENPDFPTFINTASVLDDGKIDHPVDVSADFTDFDGNSNFPFLMQDGITLYFANNGENSIGGYDIFMTRKDDTGFLNPQNIGMPYNSPYNDYMLAIDEENDVGWWATDRNAPEGKVTIYTYVLNKVRENVSSDNEDTLISFARITSIKETLKEGVNYNIYRENIIRNQDTGATSAIEDYFQFSLGNGTVITSVNQLKSPEAREKMKQLRAEISAKQKNEADLEAYRKQYREGNRNVSDRILQLEKEIIVNQKSIRALSNQVIIAENSNK